jgi:tRNA(Ile2) C34 agmatinyltransferase TiaS
MSPIHVICPFCTTSTVVPGEERTVECKQCGSTIEVDRRKDPKESSPKRRHADKKK